MRGRSSGRTPPRELAETLAAYERGDINVLVNAQILAEGWNAPRATVCMHLAPTASRRVYQQRVGRIMRLHRRKEAGIVVDFAEVGAPHSERVVTLHSLLDVDAYRPAGLVTPPPPRRRRGRRKPPKPIVKELPWIVPVSDNPERRVAVIASQWKLVDASKLPLDEQRAWAVVAARQLTPADVHTLTDRIVNLAPEARELFFFTCAAENRHRKMRLSGLGDLATSGPSQTTFAMACRLVEAAPTWQQDRGQGARVLLLAMGDAKIEAPADRIVSWTWRLARAARDHEYRYAGAHVEDGRGLLGAVANAKTDSEHSQACLRLAQVAKAAPLEAGAALLAVASPRRGTAGERIVEVARTALSADPLRLAAALGSNIPAPMQRAKTAKKTKRKAATERGETVSFNGVVVGSTPPAVPLRRVDGAAEVEVAPQVAVRLRDDADPVIRERLGVETLHWKLAGDERVFETAVEVRAAAVEVAPLQVVVSEAPERARQRAGRLDRRRRRRAGRAARARRGPGAGRRRRPPRARAAEGGRRARACPGRVRGRRRRGRGHARLAAGRRAQDRPRRAGGSIAGAPRPPPPGARPARPPGGGRGAGAARRCGLERRPPGRPRGRRRGRPRVGRVICR